MCTFIKYLFEIRLIECKYEGDYISLHVVSYAVQDKPVLTKHACFKALYFLCFSSSLAEKKDKTKLTLQVSH